MTTDCVVAVPFSSTPHTTISLLPAGVTVCSDMRWPQLSQVSAMSPRLGTGHLPTPPGFYRNFYRTG